MRYGSIPEISFSEKNLNLKLATTYQLDPVLKNCSSEDLVFTVTGDAITLEDNTITAVSIGVATIDAYLSTDETVKASLMVTVIENEELTSEITIIGDDQVEVGKKIKLEVNFIPETAVDQTVVWSSSNPEIATIDPDGNVDAIAVGTTVIKAIANDYLKAEATFTITVIEKTIDHIAPIIIIDQEVTSQNVIINYNKDFDPLKGVIATDNIDGDISSQIQYTGAVNNRKLGTYTLTYTVTDSSGNLSNQLERTITVIWDYQVTFIGHGGSYSGIMNTEEAFLNAINVHGYTALETDLKQTKDGVFVLCHDDTFGGLTLNATNYADLKNVTVTSTRGGITYTSKICTLERYLEICKEYNILAVIELKYSAGINNSDCSRMQALMNEITRMDMLDQVVLLGSQYLCLQWTRENGYEDIPCQYLVNSLESETVFNRCVTWNYDVSFNISYDNSQEWIDRYHEADLLVACYTFNQYSNPTVLQEWIDKGVDFVTVDVIKPYEVTLPEKEIDNTPLYTVNFVDDDGTILKTMVVKEGKGAVAPLDPQKNGYQFIGWDKDYRNVTEDLVVHALYQLINYTITYVENSNYYTTVAWESKEAFILDFHQDFFDWLASNVNNIPSITYTNNQYTMTLNGVTVIWTDPASLRTLEVYAFEKTLANLIYKPFQRVGNLPIIPVVDNNYFLNSEPYRTKYETLDAYFLNCCLTSYPGYDNGYNNASNGRVQIFFRFHQWCNGTNIPAFNSLPLKTITDQITTTPIILPTTITYTINDHIMLNDPIYDDQEVIFLGWYLNRDGEGDPVTEIPVGSYGDIVLYAVWQVKNPKN